MRRPALLAAAVLLAWPAAAQAASATLTVKTARGFVAATGKKAGMPAYKAIYKWSLEFHGRVLNDAGAPASGVQVSLMAIDAAGHAGVADGPHLTFADGTFVATFTADRNRVYWIHVDAAPAAGTSAFDSARVYVGAAPRIDDLSPVTSLSRAYPVRGRVELPNASHAGVVVLQRRDGKRWRMVGKKHLSKGGVYGFRVPVVSHRWVAFRLTFVPKGSGSKLYVTNAIGFRIRRE